MTRLIFVFQSTHDVIKAEPICLDQKLPCRIIAVPRQLSSECGIAIELPEEHEAAATALLKKHAVAFTLHRLPLYKEDG